MSSEPDFLNICYDDSTTFEDGYKAIKITTPNERAASILQRCLISEKKFAELDGREKDDYQTNLGNGSENNSVKIFGELTTALKDLLNSGFITEHKEKELRMTLGNILYPPPKGMAAKIAFYHLNHHKPLRSHANGDKPHEMHPSATAGNGLSKKP